MEERELLYQAELSAEWVHEFVTESNKIDPQPGPSEPGTLIYDGHREALLYAVRMAAEARYALPHAVHKLLLHGHPLAGKLRRRVSKIGLNPLLKVKDVPYFLWVWNRKVHGTIDALRTKKRRISVDQKLSEIWALHCEFESIHPYEIYNGKVGRMLLVNHALLTDLEPWIIPCSAGREDYFDLIRNHPSVEWGLD